MIDYFADLIGILSQETENQKCSQCPTIRFNVYHGKLGRKRLDVNSSLLKIRLDKIKSAFMNLGNIAQ